MTRDQLDKFNVLVGWARETDSVLRTAAPTQSFQFEAGILSRLILELEPAIRASWVRDGEDDWGNEYAAVTHYKDKAAESQKLLDLAKERLGPAGMKVLEDALQWRMHEELCRETQARESRPGEGTPATVPLPECDGTGWASS